MHGASPSRAERLVREFFPHAPLYKASGMWPSDGASAGRHAFVQYRYKSFNGVDIRIQDF